MGKCVRIRGRKPPSSPGEAAAYLTLRSGRRVPVAAAACSPPGRRRGSACRRRCGNKAACGSPGRRKSAELPSRPALDGGARPEEELPPPQASPVAHDGVDGDRGDSSGANTAFSDDGVVQLNREPESKAGVAGQPLPSPSPPLEAEMEAFFAAAELAERRRFAEAYNYDVTLDRPLEGRFEWTPVST